MGKVTDALCAHCKAVSPHNGERKLGVISIPYNRVDQYPAFPAFELTAGTGCTFCAILRHALQDKYSDEKIGRAESDFHPEIRNKWPVSGWNGEVTIGRADFITEEDWPERDQSQVPDRYLGGVYNLSFEVWPYPPRRSVISSELNRSKIWFAVYADTTSEVFPQNFFLRREPDKESLSDSNVLLISKWLSTCSRQHAECRHRSNTQLPTRVIDVGPADNSEEPRLILTSNEVGDYVAFSHCWGSLMESEAGKHARTLKINLEGMQQGLPLEKLPQNFQDAVVTVRKLKLRFLWIDALCIIQDDPEDWAREAARMNIIYGSAYLTIAATSAVSATDGFLRRPQKTASSIPYYKDLRAKPAGRFVLAYKQTSGDDGSWYWNIETVRWNTRGWTFQERLLSKRVLHFTKRKIFWECRTSDASEENEPLRDPAYRTSWLKHEGPDIMLEHSAGSLESRFEVWNNLVSRYSARKLSCETDVLPALSGLAHSFKASYGMRTSTDGDVYLAGIWRDDLSRGLLWTPHNSSHASRHSQYVAPTWSWASIKGQVFFPSGGSSTPFSPSFVDASLDWKADDRLGAIVAARLSLLAKVRRLCEVAGKAGDSWFPLDLRFEGKTIGSGAFDVSGEGGKNDVWVMQCTLQEAWDFRERPTVLLLYRSGSTPSTYERVGVGRMAEDSLGFFDDCELQHVVLI